VRRAAIAAAAGLALLFGVVAPVARASVVGVGTATFQVVVPPPQYAGFASGSVRGLHISGQLVFGSQAPYVDVSIGAFKGLYDWCGSAHCGYVGNVIRFTDTAVTFLGFAKGGGGGGGNVYGHCHGGQFKFGAFGGGVLTTTCNATVRGVPTGDFTLTVGGDVENTASSPLKFTGHFCTDASCGVVLDVPNPGLFSP